MVGAGTASGEGRRPWGALCAGGLLLLAAPGARAAADLSAMVRSEWAVETRTGRFHKLELVVEPQLELDLPLELELTAVGRLRADVFDRLEPGQPRPVETSDLSRRALLGTNLDLELRELFVEARAGPAFLTLGKQQIVWGQADGLKVLDVVDPQDFREFILEPFDRSRIPRWAVNAEIPLRAVVLQLVWLPDPTFDVVPEPGSAFAFSSPQIVPPPPPGATARFRPFDVPSRHLADSDGGARLSTLWRGWDLALLYLYRYGSFPVFPRSLRAEPGGPVAIFAPSYERTHLVGASFSNAFGNLTLRGELAWTTDRVVSVGDPADADGLARMGELAGVLGFDWHGFRESLVSLQVFQRALTRDPRGLLPDRFSTTVTLLLRREFLHDRLVADAIWIHDVDDGDGLVRPRVEYELRDDLRVWAGFDLFYGRRRGVFGEFNARDRAVVGVALGL